jgi:hypothetical protein
MKNCVWVKIVGVLLISGVMLFDVFKVNGQVSGEEQKTLSPKEAAKIKEEKAEALIKELALRREMRAKAVEAVKKWAKETDFEKMGQEVVDYAKSKNLIANFSIKEAGAETDFRIPKFLFVKVMSPLLENVTLQLKDVSVGDIISSYLTFGDYVFPASKDLAEKKITCYLRNIERIKALNLLLKSNNYELLFVYKEQEEQVLGFQNLYCDIREKGMFETPADYYIADVGGPTPLWLDDFLHQIMTEKDKEYANADYQWLINNNSRMSQYYIIYIKNRIDGIVKYLSTEFRVIIKTGG